MRESSKISIVLPVYNAEKYLNGIISDIIRQTYANWELIVVDDGSTDNSWSIIQKYAQKDNRIKTITVENGGPSKARNIGIDQATGEYIRFVDADDRVPATSLYTLISPFINDNDIDLVIGNFVSRHSVRFFTGEQLQEKKISQAELVNLFIEYIKTFYIGVPWNKLYKLSIIANEKIRFNERVDWCEDFMFNIDYFRCIKYAYIVNVKNGIYQYIMCDSGITVGLHKRHSSELEYIEKLRYKKAKEFCAMHLQTKEFEQQWKFSDLYKRLTVLTMYRSTVLSDRYAKFVTYLSEQGTYEYVCRKYEQLKSVSWLLLKKALKKKSYYGVFLYFIFKGYTSRFIPGLKILFEKKDAAL